MNLIIQIGNFHPLLVHLPIGIIILAFVIEYYAKWKKWEDTDKVISLILVVGLGFSILSVSTGLLLAENGDYNSDAIKTHKWLGIAMTSATAIILYLKNGNQSWSQKIYFPMLWVVLILLILTGHYGGTLTHGEGFLFSTNEDMNEDVVDVDQAIVYRDIIAPLLKRKCNSCHNPSKAKGKLDMTSTEGLILGGKGGAVLDFNNPAESSILKRIHLPTEEKKHMPPKAKKQLAENEIQILDWWIKNNACLDCSVSSLSTDEEFKETLEKYLAPSRSATSSQQYPAIKDKVIASLAKDKINVETISAENNTVAVNLSNKNIKKSTINKLSKIKDNLIEVNLANSNLSDGMSKGLGKLHRLQKLQLQNTQITSASLKYLKPIKELASLNLYGTSIDDSGIEYITSLKGLQNLYLYQTKVTPDGITKIEEEMPLLDIQYQMDTTIFGSSELNPPMIVTVTDFFRDSLLVELKSNFRNTSLYYSLDGTPVDTNSLRYDSAFTVNNSLTIQALTYKEGWAPSNVATRQLLKSNKNIEHINIRPGPSERYKASGTSSLHDLMKGTTNFVDGNWLGFEGTDAEMDIVLTDKSDVNGLVLSVLSAPGSWIFNPKQVNISTSEDGNTYSDVISKDIESETGLSTVATSFIHLDFEPRSAKYLKLKVVGMKNNPPWHPNPGGKSWLFMDEIVIR